MRTSNAVIIRCDICGLAKEDRTTGWRNIELSFNSDEDSNDRAKQRVWRHSFQDLCPQCYAMMAKRILSSLSWAVKL